MVSTGSNRPAKDLAGDILCTAASAVAAHSEQQRKEHSEKLKEIQQAAIIAPTAI